METDGLAVEDQTTGNVTLGGNESRLSKRLRAVREKAPKPIRMAPVVVDGTAQPHVLDPIVTTAQRTPGLAQRLSSGLAGRPAPTSGAAPETGSPVFDALRKYTAAITGGAAPFGDFTPRDPVTGQETLSDAPVMAVKGVAGAGLRMAEGAERITAKVSGSDRATALADRLKAVRAKVSALPTQTPTGTTGQPVADIAGGIVPYLAGGPLAAAGMAAAEEASNEDGGLLGLAGKLTGNKTLTDAGQNPLARAAAGVGSVVIPHAAITGYQAIKAARAASRAVEPIAAEANAAARAAPPPTITADVAEPPALTPRRGTEADQAARGLSARLAKLRSEPPALHDGTDFVNPIDPAAPPHEQLRQIRALSAQSDGVLNELKTRLDTSMPGTVTSVDHKSDTSILGKSQRPEILAERPDFGIQHIRDTIRFKTALNSIEELPALLGQARELGMTPVKIDTRKWANPKEYGWRFVAIDFRMPNGQLAEWYAAPHELIAENKVNHRIFEHWRTQDLSALPDAERDVFHQAVARTAERYAAATGKSFLRNGTTWEDHFTNRWPALEREIHAAAGPVETPLAARSASESAAPTAAGSVTGDHLRPTSAAGPENASAAEPNSQVPSGLRTDQPPGPPLTPSEPPPGDLKTAIPIAPSVVGDNGKILRGPVGRNDVSHIGGRSVQTRYRVVEASELVPSNDPANSFQPHPDYPPEIQGRVYHGEAGLGARERTVEMAGQLEPSKVTHPSRSVNGPPIVTPNGVVVAGNQRTMAQMIAHRSGRGEPIRAAITQDADLLGIDRAQLAGMREPVVVREIVDPGVNTRDAGQLAQLNQASDVGGMKAKDPLVEAAGRARQMARDPSVLEHFAATIDPEEGLADYLRSTRGLDLLNRMVKADVIRPNELDAYRDAATGKLTAQGRTKVAEIVQSAALGGDVRVLADAPPAMLAKMEQAWPNAVKASTADGWSLEGELKDALKLHAQRVDTGAKSIDDALAQSDMFGRTGPDERATTLARFLEGKKKGEVTEAFRRYADAAGKAGAAESAGADMFGNSPETADEAFRRIFGAPRPAMSGNRAGAVGAQPEGVRVPGSLAGREDPYNVAAVKMMGALAGGPGGGVGGARIGGSIGDTPEERRRNRMLGAGLGALAGTVAPFAPELAEQIANKVRSLRAVTEALPETAEEGARFALRPSPSLIRLRIEGQPTRPQIESLLEAVKANPKAGLRYTWRTKADEPLATGRDLASLFSDLQSNMGRRAGAIGDQPDLFGGPTIRAEPDQGSMFGAAEGTAGARNLAQTEAAAREELARLNRYGERIPAKLAARKAELEKLVNRDRAISPDEIATRVRGGEDLFGNRTGAIGNQTTPPARESFEDFNNRLAAERDQRRANVASALGDGTKPVRFTYKGDSESAVVVHRSAQRPGIFQVSHFEEGHPVAHDEYPSLQKVVDELSKDHRLTLDRPAVTDQRGRWGAIGAQPGERRTRGLSASVEAKAVTNKLTDSLGDLPEYERMSMAEQSGRAVALLQDNPKLARRIALGTARPPDGLLPESVFVAVENHAIRTGDVATIRELASGRLTTEATTMGQRIRTLAERDPESPVTAIQDVIATRMSVVKDAPKATDSAVAAIREHVAKAMDVTQDTWHRFIDSLRC